jgi:group II intron reverse transcriptase/maturase
MQGILRKDLIHEERGKRNLKLERVYRELYDADRYLACYARLYPNQGAMTPGVTEETVDAMSVEKVEQIIQTLRDSKFSWQPAKRVYIPKKNGKMRPLGLPTWTDKLLQDVIRSILEPYYEAKFRNSSHGFRPNRGCHTALRSCQARFEGATWFIEGDIKGCFDNINHDVLMSILEESIDDQRFLRLIREMLDAGYMENWQYHRTHSGTPQGGVVSPLLANIYLDKLDAFVEDTLIPMYTRGEARKRNPEYDRVNRIMYKAKRQGNMGKWKTHKALQRTIPSGDPNDPNFRRLSYVRYADDFVLAFIGPKEEARDIKEKIRIFLRDTLKLEMSNEKTLITHAKSEKARFLGYDLTIIQANGQLTTGGNPHGKYPKRAINGKLRLEVPEDKVREIAKQFMEGNQIAHRKEQLENDDFSIVNWYGAMFRGIANYYCMAHDRAARMAKVQYVMETSMLKTLANKHKSSVSAMARKYKVWVDTPNGKRKAFQVHVKREGKKDLIATFGGITLARQIKTIEDNQHRWWWNSRTEILERLNADKCEYCGTEGKCQVHHIKKVGPLLKRTDLKGWKKLMAMKQRKTLVLCQSCHYKLHAGQLD